MHKLIQKQKTFNKILTGIVEYATFSDLFVRVSFGDVLWPAHTYVLNARSETFRENYSSNGDTDVLRM